VVGRFVRGLLLSGLLSGSLAGQAYHRLFVPRGGVCDLSVGGVVDGSNIARVTTYREGAPTNTTIDISNQKTYQAPVDAQSITITSDRTSKAQLTCAEQRSYLAVVPEPPFGLKLAKIPFTSTYNLPSKTTIQDVLSLPTIKGANAIVDLSPDGNGMAYVTTPKTTTTTTLRQNQTAQLDIAETAKVTTNPTTIGLAGLVRHDFGPEFGILALNPITPRHELTIPYIFSNNCSTPPCE